MSKLMIGILLLVIGAGLGYGLGRSRGEPAPTDVPVADVMRRVGELSERELEEYRALKDLKARYEKADELLGKVMLVLIADLGLRVSPRHEQTLRDSARGLHPEVREPVATRVERTPPAQAHAPAAARDSTASPPLPSVPSSTETARAEIPEKPSPRSRVPFRRLVRREARNPCANGERQWYIAGSAPDEYRMEIDPRLSRGSDRVVMIQGLKPNPRNHAELNHCADVGAVAGKRVRFTAWIKAENVADYANVHFRAENSRRERLRNERKSFDGTFDWKLYSIEMDVPPEAASVHYGITFESAGKAWIRYPSMQVVEPT